MSRLRELLDQLRARQSAEQKAADDDDRDRWVDEGGSPAPHEPPPGADRR